MVALLDSGRVSSLTARRPSSNGKSLRRQTTCEITAFREVDSAEEAREYRKSVEAAGWRVTYLKVSDDSALPAIDDQLLDGLCRSIDRGDTVSELLRRVDYLANVISKARKG
jgi:hypothetical protein